MKENVSWMTPTHDKEPFPCPLSRSESEAGILLDYCHRKLDAHRTAILESHLRQCPACQSFASAQSLVWRALDEYEAMPISETFDRRLYARIEAEEQRPTWVKWCDGLWNRLTVGGTATGAWLWRPALPVLACLLVAIGLYFRPSFDSTQQSLQGPSTDTTLQAEQIEAALEDLEMLRDLGALDAGWQRPM
ncbi:MAG: hypothetical protein NZV14_09965 [Bryobacteraceae bacterium]|nr:hypothetical protein [Bryobacteraceae bacterium]MDW8378477.1 hypothetical protein [Bryobacterales bacterium]